MTNNKQHNPIDWLSNQFYELLEQYSEGNFDRIKFNELMLAMTYEARDMYKDKMESVIIKQCAKQSTSEASKYADGYKEGYKRALDYMTDTIKNKIEVMENANNEFKKGTANTTHTTFLCTEFVSDASKGATLPRCIRCGKTQRIHPIITKTMSNNKQQTAVDIIYQGMSDKIVMQDLNKGLICIHISHDDFLKLHKQAKEMEKQQIINAVDDQNNYDSWPSSIPTLGEQYYNEAYGGNK
jgi:hypothetical protein